ncbi:MAG: hypothetical protein ACRECH_09650 [Nitrososphaerales archaeon]
MHWINPPGWSSLESVQRIHGDLELLAILLFGLLVLADILEHAVGDTKRKHFLTICGFVFFALAVLTELAAYPYGQRSAILSNSQIRNDEQVISKISGEVITASQHADDAALAAKKAKESAKEANSLAHGARKEADSFERDIISAKEQAAKAESNLAEALRQAAKAQSELNLLRTPRRLRNVSEFVALVRPFTGTEYTFEGVRHDDESAHLLTTIYSALQEAKWKIVPPIVHDISQRFLALAGAPTFRINDDSDDGILIVAEISRGYGPGMSPNDLPAHVKAALSLRTAIIATLFPREPHPRKLSLRWGTSPVVQIFIGRKAP